MPNFEYANARARALQVNILGQERINRLLDCIDADEALKILLEVGYGDSTFSGKALGFEQLLRAEQKKLFDFLQTSCDFLPLLRFFTLKNDFHNAECLIKAKHLQMDVSDFLEISGQIPVENLRERIFADDYGAFPENLKNALLTCDELFVSKRATGENINATMEKWYFKELKNQAVKNKYLLKIYNVKADCANLAIALRSRNFALAKESFVELGELSLTNLKALCEEQLDTLKNKFKLCSISNIIDSAIQEAMQNLPLSSFENQADSYAINLVKQDRYATESILPTLQYCLYKLADITNVRIIMVGLINHLDKEQIRKRLRGYYEG